MAKMLGKKVPTCCMGDRCSNAHDGEGKRKERRITKKREKRYWQNEKRRDDLA